MRPAIRISAPRFGWACAVVLALIARLCLGAEAQPLPSVAPVHLELTARPGETFKSAKVDAWVPPGAAPIRAIIIHQHGCGDDSALAAAALISDQHWRAFAREQHSVLLVLQFFAGPDCANWNTPSSGSERELFSTLDELARRTGRPEIVSAPWVLWGHSGGASWAVQMIVLHPGRTVALALRGGASAQFGDADFRDKFAHAAADLPMLFVWGAAEGSPKSRHHVSWGPMHLMAEQLRLKGARLAVAVDPTTEHHCGNSRLLVLPFFAAVLNAPISGSVNVGIFVHRTDGSAASSVADARFDPACAWLPTPALAETYRDFVQTGTVAHVEPLRTIPELRGVIQSDRPELSWRISPAIDSGLRAIRIYRNGAILKELGVGAADFIAEFNDTPPPELRLEQFTDSSAQRGLTYEYALSFVNCVGAESLRSAPVVLTVPYLPASG